MGWRLAPLGRFLDVRPHGEFEAEPLSEAVNIPFEELPRRLHELPPKYEAVEVLDTGSEAEQVLAFLKKGGRMALLVSLPLPPSSFSRASETRKGVPQRLWRPNAFLEETLPRLPVGRALDLGCGSGREAVAMAGAGFQVIAIDNLPDALEMGRELARRYLIGAGAPPIEWVWADLEAPGTSIPLPPSSSGAGGGGNLDLITSFRYLHRPLLAQVRDRLAPGGSLLLETFTVLHRERHGKPRQDAHILQLGEAPTLVPGLEIVHFDEAWRGESHTARLWAKKP